MDTFSLCLKNLYQLSSHSIDKFIYDNLPVLEEDQERREDANMIPVNGDNGLATSNQDEDMDEGINQFIFSNRILHRIRSGKLSFLKIEYC